jgi:glycerol-3-phosphate acyltransferase PlsX
MSKVVISLDAMGGDRGPEIVVPAALQALRKHLNLHLILVGPQDVLKPYLEKYPSLDHKRITVHHASEVIGMGESPAQALRYKKDSSMRVAINLVKSGEAQACVSAGNTGALMATARFVLKTLPGIDRPAIVGLFPALNKAKRVWLLDLGANVDCSPEMVFQFAVMGSILASAMEETENPKVALLNIGSEEIKGNEQVRETARLLSKSKLINYTGFVEGSDIFKGVADVIVCDGFVGNVALKTMEGLAKFMGGLIKEAFSRNFMAKLAGVFAMFGLRSLRKTMDPDLYNGATFLGLRGIVVKSHGHTTIKGYEQAIEQAIVEVEHNVPDLIAHELSRLFEKTT